MERAVASAEASDWNTDVERAVAVAEGAGCKRSEKRGNSVVIVEGVWSILENILYM